MTDDPDRLVTLGEAAPLVGRHPNALYKWMAKGRFAKRGEKAVNGQPAALYRLGDIIEASKRVRAPGRPRKRAEAGPRRQPADGPRTALLAADRYDDETAAEVMGVLGLHGGSGMLSQMQLVGAILIHLDESGVKDVNARQMNAVIRAADDILAALGDPHRPASPGMGLAAWLASDDTGTSSRYMAWALAPAAGLSMLRHDSRHPDPWPHDPDDFGRCVRLLEAVPELRPHIPLLTDSRHGSAWNAIAAEWDTLEAWYREDLPTGKSARLFARLTDIERLACTPPTT